MSELHPRRLVVLGLGHTCADFCQGAVPALLPFLAAQRGYSYGALGALVLAASIGSSLLQPLFGVLSDRSGRPWLMPVGLLLGGGGLAAVGLARSYEVTVAALVVSGIGVAAFHPEAARFANLASGAQRGRGMSIFSLGGNAGFALGPILTTPLVALLGLHGTPWLLALPLTAALALVVDLPRLRGLERRPAYQSSSADVGRAADQRDAWGPFARLGLVVALRSGVYFGLQTFIPVYFVTEFGLSETAGNSALTVMLLAGAVGTLAGGEAVDRLGARAVLVGSIGLLCPLLVALPFVGATLATALLAVIGFCTISSFSVTVVLGQQYLPSRLGLASGVTLGLAIGVGGLAAAALGTLADHVGVAAVIWTVAALPLPALVLAWSLPRMSPHRSWQTKTALGA